MASNGDTNIDTDRLMSQADIDGTPVVTPAPTMVIWDAAIVCAEEAIPQAQQFRHLVESVITFTDGTKPNICITGCPELHYTNGRIRQLHEIENSPYIFIWITGSLTCDIEHFIQELLVSNIKDRNRIVPVCKNKDDIPMGFRTLHCIDLSMNGHDLDKTTAENVNTLVLKGIQNRMENAFGKRLTQRHPWLPRSESSLSEEDTQGYIQEYGLLRSSSQCQEDAEKCKHCGKLVVKQDRKLSLYTQKGEEAMEIIQRVGRHISELDLTKPDINSINYCVAFVMEVNNHTHWTFKTPFCYPKSGHIQKQPDPRGILPGCQSVISGHKTSSTATGTYGTISWEVEGLDVRVIIMWSVPYNQNHFSNWLALGVINKEEHTSKQFGFSKMYHGKPTGFKRSEFYKKCSLLIYSNGRLKLEGNMGSSHKTTITINVTKDQIETTV